MTEDEDDLSHDSKVEREGLEDGSETCYGVWVRDRGSVQQTKGLTRMDRIRNEMVLKMKADDPQWRPLMGIACIFISA